MSLFISFVLFMLILFTLSTLSIKESSTICLKDSIGTSESFCSKFCTSFDEITLSASSSSRVSSMPNPVNRSLSI
uniref:Putative secreted protein n=1 Tax=Panstrongylus lignarius TaxID=156445 RepID=A0A224Y418_9HEMI